MELLCDAIICGGPEFNYSSEGAELTPPFFSVVYPNPHDGIDTEWTMAGCLYICTSYISQEDADLCALRQSVLCTTPPGEDIWYSAPATCCVPCPDGAEYCYVVPAGMFIAKTFAEAESQAQAYACQQAQDTRICLSNIPRCACLGVHYSGIIESVGNQTWVVVGTIPPGLTFTGNGNTAFIVGTPTVNGTYAFQVIATGSNGSYSIKTFTIQVVEITTTAIDGFVIGTPYSFQLQAAGGSGNYNWRVVTGTLPDGLTLSEEGLISGTPTASAIGDTLTFEVIDLTCEAADHRFFTPRVTLSSHGLTTIKTKRGWADFHGGVVLYKSMNWTGYQVQLALTAGDAQTAPEFCGGARYVYGGFSQIDLDGNFTSSHSKDLYFACSKQPFPTISSNIYISGSQLLGYCWHLDPGSCSTCSNDEDTWSYFGDVASHSQYDFPSQMIQAGQFVSNTATSWTYLSGGFIAGSLALLIGTQNFPATNWNQVLGEWATIASDGNWSVTLSNEYTDADAASTALHYSNNSSVSENIPDYRQWEINSITNRSSRTTHVDYVLNLTNLVVGEEYLVGVDWIYSNGTIVNHAYAFTADSTTHQIADSLPTPGSNGTITVKNPRVIFSP